MRVRSTQPLLDQRHMLQHQRRSNNIVRINEAGEVEKTGGISQDEGEKIKHKAGTTNNHAEHMLDAINAVNMATSRISVARLSNSNILNNSYTHFVSSVGKKVILV